MYLDIKEGGNKDADPCLSKISLVILVYWMVIQPTVYRRTDRICILRWSGNYVYWMGIQSAVIYLNRSGDCVFTMSDSVMV